MKKAFSVIIGLVLLIALAGCSGKTSGDTGGSSKGADYPKKNINVIVAYEAGGGTDVGARILIPYVEKELGVTMNILNKPGGGGWVGWGELANAKPDGYTIGYINTPNLMTGYLDPKLNRKQNLESFEPIANHVIDPGAIAIRTDEDRFTNIEELIEYAKNNELTATSTGVGSDDHYASLKINDKYGTKFKPVHNKGAADSRASVLGGHVDVLFANVGELASLHKDGEIKIIGVMGEEKSPFLPEVPTLLEKGYEVTSWSARGLAAPAGIDPEILEVLRAAFEKGIKNEEQKEKMGDMGLQVDYSDGDEYKQLLKDDEDGVKALSDLMGW
ncbi:tripartite tricarboxylate transporter substrate binding protein [Cytobacillus firmus]|uniref:tripartite tricarboxylate transporter substrate binding protein n=1 Tax=Cytobacillus firmus TaxID=1399 RepID=UPI001C9399D4|nr:tripartite tricarboxylate transporter substrate binding protein [Cytobacillus firmus]MBY6051062.1 tripartite tricarboxylate transporter substrate binding protein [Cytobacillus firmus]USK38064.1 tripartite tricarboxylate transporter substrate binding protein [Cytobacillus firmus]